MITFANQKDEIMYKTKIKISNVNNLTDARYCAAREVDFISYALDSVENGIDLLRIKAIKEWVEGPNTIIEVGMESQEFLKEIFATTHPAFIQIPAYYDFNVSLQTDFPIIKEIIIENPINKSLINDQLKTWGNIPYLFDFSKNGIAWRMLKNMDMMYFQNIMNQQDIWVDIHAELNEWDELLSTITPIGLSIKSNGEEKTGYKSFDELDEILDVLSK